MQELLDAVKKVDELARKYNANGVVVKMVTIAPWTTSIALSQGQTLIDTAWMESINAQKCEVEIDGVTVRVEVCGE